MSVDLWLKEYLSLLLNLLVRQNQPRWVEQLISLILIATYSGARRLDMFKAHPGLACFKLSFSATTLHLKEANCLLAAAWSPRA